MHLLTSVMVIMMMMMMYLVKYEVYIPVNLSTAHQFRTPFSASACVQPAAIKSPFHATGSSRTADDLELTTRRHAGS